MVIGLIKVYLDGHDPTSTLLLQHGVDQLLHYDSIIKVMRILFK